MEMSEMEWRGVRRSEIEWSEVRRSVMDMVIFRTIFFKLFVFFS